MSPELLDQDHPNFRGGQRTKESDCYTLGMVIYEVLNFIVPKVVIEGKHSERSLSTEMACFVDDLWTKVEQCWSDRSMDRPTAETLLECMEGFGSSAVTTSC